MPDGNMAARFPKHSLIIPALVLAVLSSDFARAAIVGVLIFPSFEYEMVKAADLATGASANHPGVHLD